jgi:fatty acid/phospholipid synthesis protein PlsX
VGVWYAFHDVHLARLHQTPFVGLRNFTSIFTGPFPNLLNPVVTVTGIWVIGAVIFQVGVGLGLALLLQQRWVKGRDLFRSLYLFPWVISGIVVGYSWRFVFDPTVGLLNVGEEPEKGGKMQLEAFGLLRAARDINFHGNVEGDDIYKGTVDVVVCDGFVGNSVLKASEGVATMIVAFLRQEFSRNPWRKLSALIAMPVLKALRARMDPGHYNGASLLGLKDVVIKSHGSADRYAFGQALRRAVEEVRNDVVRRISDRMAGVGA